MQELFSQVKLIDFQQDVMRNIVSISNSQHLFDDLSDDPHAWKLAQNVELDVKPPMYLSNTPIIHRPFETLDWANAIGYPFTHWQSSRYSDGSFGVWYGSKQIETTVYETVYHWYNGFLRDAGFHIHHEPVIAERRIYRINCSAALLDFRPLLAQHPDLINKTDYHYTQNIGAKLHREGHPGIVTGSARDVQGQNIVITNPNVLSNPRHECFLTYCLNGKNIEVKQANNHLWLTLDTTDF